ncbi:nicotinate phosphoribosyltransferase [Reticulomyxa filosa]|uniref:Nicotinate phosphoribosyltransferase n=1 Tax=Reticulomyxa filosa TaxID=46433 RepID=X6M766_RETFI|nr:nicotinate phosphoribosyltransferase [Reticulomyxa filosa]|eukprot:ETO09461.1 nicotinate phosphoribosyltransferase [Reticulomyxa filosa]
MREGDVVFPRVPMIRVEGPVAICQLVETTLLNCVNYASLIATNAARMREAVSDEENKGTKKNVRLLEFGLRRAQGPDGAMSGSKYAYLGGFDSTSNVLAGITFDIAISGTHAHSFVTSFSSLDQVHMNSSVVIQWYDSTNKQKKIKDGKDLKSKAIEYRNKLKGENTNEGELAAFIAYAISFPAQFLALIDTYNTLESGLVNFMSVALALNDAGYRPLGIRLDSGDLSYLSKKCRLYFQNVSRLFELDYIEHLSIVVSNDINEEVLYALKEQGHEIDAFGIGTHLVTCQKQPALGCVYKLVAIEHSPRIKISEDIGKMTLPGIKSAYRLYIRNNEPLVDLLILDDEMQEDVPNSKKSRRLLEPKRTVRCYHPSNDLIRVDIVPDRVEPLLIKVWDGKLKYKSPSLDEIRQFCLERVRNLRKDYKRVVNPTPYKVSVSKKLKDMVQELIEKETPVRTIQ